jgi:hypothetical protein
MTVQAGRDPAGSSGLRLVWHPQRVGYYAPLLAMFDQCRSGAVVKAGEPALFLARDSVTELLRALQDWRPVRGETAGSETR